ncbi:hypothetical protein [Caldilinea aerophila]|uniref:hypothetical protein n=1 Tax=Caldilinea aerophila TaxID=133453 RepID=UPI0005C60FD6|nr:hypothetical protein [Caldilinea aerophila]
MNSKNFELLCIKERRRREKAVFLMTIYDFFCVYTLSSAKGGLLQKYAGQWTSIDLVYESPHFKSRVKNAWTAFEEYERSDAYNDFLKKYYLELLAKGWKPVDNKPFTFKLYRESSKGKSLDEMENMLRQMLALRNNTRFLDQSEKSFLIALTTPKQGWTDEPWSENEHLDKGLDIVQTFYEMVVSLRNVIEKE